MWDEFYLDLTTSLASALDVIRLRMTLIPLKRLYRAVIFGSIKYLRLCVVLEGQLHGWNTISGVISLRTRQTIEGTEARNMFVKAFLPQGESSGGIWRPEERLQSNKLPSSHRRSKPNAPPLTSDTGRMRPFIWTACAVRTSDLPLTLSLGMCDVMYELVRVSLTFLTL